MPVLELNNISKSYDQKSLVVQNISFSLERDDFLVLLGPSGCGKSTILNMIAGLESVTSGDIFLNGVRINDLSSQNRNIAMVFQNYALYPNMTVWDNIAFPLKNRHMKKLEIINAINKIAETLSIKPLLKKYPSQLSGGEKQRVAIGRALVRNPSLFLLDEPLSNLDTALRNQLRYELFQLKSKVDVPMVYVTHDQVEALTLATKIIILSNGVIQQIGSPHEIFNSPQNLFVAKFICYSVCCNNFVHLSFSSYGRIISVTIFRHRFEFNLCRILQLHVIVFRSDFYFCVIKHSFFCGHYSTIKFSYQFVLCG